jgi:amino acid transporter
MSASPEDSLSSDGLIRGLGRWDATLLTVGSVIGTGIFITTADIARVLPHEGMILLVWTLGGFLTLAGALTYAELGTLYPRAGGMYHYLKEAYGTFWGFLYGWACFLVIMSGGIAALALPLDAIAETARIGETAAAALFGDGGGRLMSFAILVSTFGCLSATILFSPRIYLAMSRDGVFFRGLGAVHPRFHTPGRSLWAQSLWAVLLTLSGTLSSRNPQNRCSGWSSSQRACRLTCGGGGIRRRIRR